MIPGNSWEKPRALVPKAAKAPWEMIPVGEGLAILPWEFSDVDSYHEDGIQRRISLSEGGFGSGVDEQGSTTQRATRSVKSG